MENPSGASNNPPQPQLGQNAQLIRTDQVQKLPHLNDAQKNTHTQAVRTLWNTLSTQPPGSDVYQSAHLKLTQLSTQLMKGMKLWQQNRAQQAHLQQQQAQIQQQQQQTQQQAQQIQQNQQGQQQQSQQPQQQSGQQQQQPQHQQQQPQMSRPNPQAATINQANPARPQHTMPQNFSQLLPQIQVRINSVTILTPPSMNKAQADGWLTEAKYRYGLALQKQEVGKIKMAEFRAALAQRQGTGVALTAEEAQEFQKRHNIADKLWREGGEFIKKFNDQQEAFRNPQAQAQTQAQTQAQAQAQVQQAQNQGQQPQAPAQAQAQVQAQAQAATPQFGNRPGVPNVPGQGQVAADMNRPQTGVTGAPAPHTINSAVVAARNQASQGPQAQLPNQAMPQQQQPRPPQQIPNQQQPQMPPNTQQRPFSQGPESAGQMNAPQGPPRPLSQQAAMAQAAQNYSNAVGQQAMAGQAAAQAAQAANTHAHPHFSRPETGSRNVTMQIPKTLNVAPPEPVTMGPSRPTLTAGASHGTLGMVGQPAIPRHPGYVLEGEGQRVMSKKNLASLVRQVTGGGEGNELTPDAEEVRFFFYL